jgi:hypothetical protein
MPVTSRVPALIDYLVGIFTTALAAATPPATVYDGPVTTDDAQGLVLWVGMDDPDGQGAPLSATSSQTWAGLGKLARNEEITINCVAEAWSGVDNVKSQRDAVYAVVAIVEELVRTDAAQFGGNALFADPGMTGMDLRQNDTGTGGQARVSFQLTFKSRIGGG